jgi:hypothetical protein
MLKTTKVDLDLSMSSLLQELEAVKKKNEYLETKMEWWEERIDRIQSDLIHLMNKQKIDDLPLNDELDWSDWNILATESTKLNGPENFSNWKSTIMDQLEDMGYLEGYRLPKKDDSRLKAKLNSLMG